MISFPHIILWICIGTIIVFGIIIILDLFGANNDGSIKSIFLSFKMPQFRRTKPKLEDYLEDYAKFVPGHNASHPDFKLIIMAMTDVAFTDMALNLYTSSFKRFGIENYLFVGAGNNACANLVRRNIHCFDFWEDPDSNRSNIFGSKKFNRKMNIRTEMILVALRANYSVLHMDLDIVFLRNPMLEIENLLQKHSMAILWDHILYNAGFLAIKATPFSIEIYEEIRMRTNKSLSSDDQGALNKALAAIEPKYEKKKIFGSFSTILDRKKFLSGRNYFEQNRNFPRADFSDNCQNCMVVHNNWIISKEAKVHRFRETLMWFIDEDRYYSDENRKYLLFSNPVLKNSTDFDVRKSETMALRTGFKIAAMLNRTLIISRFHCDKVNECPLNSWFKVKPFHEQFFPNYRESSFLLNNLVPRSISMKPVKKCSLTSDNAFNPSKTSSMTCNNQNSDPNSKCISFTPIPILLLTTNSTNYWHSTLTTLPMQQIINLISYDIIDDFLIRKIFGHCQDQVLVLSSLFGVEVSFKNQTKESMFNKHLDKGLIPGNYIQH